MTHTVEEIRALYELDGEDCFEKIHDDGGWSQEHKIQLRFYVGQLGDQYFQVTENRSGSPFTDWHYEEPEIAEVTRHAEEVKMTVVKWIPVE